MYLVPLRLVDKPAAIDIAKTCPLFFLSIHPSWSSWRLHSIVH